MGLDQYLYRKLYIGAEYHHENVGNLRTLQLTGGIFDSIEPTKVSYIVESAGYWRKANQIHTWFVDNTQDGNDNCQTSYVGREQLHELLDLVNGILGKIELTDGKLPDCTTFEGGKEVTTYVDGKVISNPEVCEDLPTGAGFFFGSTNYDEGYVEDLKSTKKILEENLAEKYKDWEFEYHASW